MKYYNAWEAMKAIAAGDEGMIAWCQAHDVYVPSEYTIRNRDAEYIALVVTGKVEPMSSQAQIKAQEEFDKRRRG